MWLNGRWIDPAKLRIVFMLFAGSALCAGAGMAMNYAGVDLMNFITGISGVCLVIVGLGRARAADLL